MIQVLAIETIYAFLIILFSLLSFFKVYKFAKFSRYKGLLYYSHAFLLIPIGFSFRYIVMLTNIIKGQFMSTISSFNLLLGFMEFFMILPAFFLLYSLIWKKFEKEKYSKSLFSYPEALFLLIALIIVLLDNYFQTLVFLYISQITIFSIAFTISTLKAKQKPTKSKTLYSVSMLLFLIIWIVNFIAQYTIDNFPIIRIYTYVATIITVLILYSINIKLTKH